MSALKGIEGGFSLIYFPIYIPAKRTEKKLRISFVGSEKGKNMNSWSIEYTVQNFNLMKICHICKIPKILENKVIFLISLNNPKVVD